MSTSLCLADADVLIDGVKYGFLGELIGTHTIGVATSAFWEIRFYRDVAGTVHTIDLGSVLTTGSLTLVSATATELQAVYIAGVSTRLGRGELESIALVVARGFTFCTADHLAVKAMRALGVGGSWIPLEDLLGAFVPPQRVPEPKYLRSAVK